MSEHQDHSGDEMVEDELDGEDREIILAGRRHRGRNLILRSTAVLPALLTVMNGICGFASIHFATKDALGHAGSLNLAFASWLIFAAMIFDMLDGRVARMTRLTSDFGAQLDSLCDAISFGVAPAVLMLRTVITAMPENFGAMSTAFERIVWCIAAVYTACAVLRLARFNVENEPDESAHMMFKGLPSPAAAATVASLVLLLVHVIPNLAKENATTALWSPSTLLPLITKYAAAHDIVYWAFAILLPIVTLTAAIMMVSRVNYPHLVNQYLRGKKSFAYLVRLIIILVALVLEFVLTAAVMIMIYFLSGIIKSLRRKDNSPYKPAIVTPVPDHPKLPMNSQTGDSTRSSAEK